MSTTTVPSPSGYMPVEGEGFASITVDVAVSRNYQKVQVSGTYTFPQPRSYSDMLPAFDDAYEGLKELAELKLDELVSGDAAPKAAPAPAVETDPAGFATGKTQAGEDILYLPTSTVGTDRLKAEVLRQADELGLPADQLVVFDERYDLEKGKPAYRVATVKASKDTDLAAEHGTKRLAEVSTWNADKSVTLTLTSEGHAVAEASFVNKLDGTPVANA